MIFVHDKHKIAMDLGGKRKFYNSITELETEADRTGLLAPVSGGYYFVIATAVLWTYQNGWVQITHKPEEIVFIGTEFPELGSATTLYVDKENLTIKVWDETTGAYIVIAEKTESISVEDIEAMFNN